VQKNKRSISVSLNKEWQHRIARYDYVPGTTSGGLIKTWIERYFMLVEALADEVGQLSDGDIAAIVNDAEGNLGLAIWQATNAAKANEAQRVAIVQRVEDALANYMYTKKEEDHE